MAFFWLLSCLNQVSGDDNLSIDKQTNLWTLPPAYRIKIQGPWWKGRRLWAVSLCDQFCGFISAVLFLQRYSLLRPAMDDLVESLPLFAVSILMPCWPGSCPISASRIVLHLLLLWLPQRSLVPLPPFHLPPCQLLPLHGSLHCAGTLHAPFASSWMPMKVTYSCYSDSALTRDVGQSFFFSLAYHIEL